MHDYERISRVIRFLDERHLEQPSLNQLAEVAGLSQFHFQRLFARWAGVTPKDFLQCLTVTHAKKKLRNGTNVLNASLDVGLSGPGRLHDLCVKLEAASPGEVKSGGAGWTITAGFADSPFGNCLLGESPRGLCHVSFVSIKNRKSGGVAIQASWPHAHVHWDNSFAERTVAMIFRDGADTNGKDNLRAYVRGTEFQLRVWRALLQIPSGTLVSYGQIAESLGDRSAARAVGSAIGQNSLAYLIPCHRVIRETGVLGEYRWGPVRKKAIVAWENAAQIG